jgi:hypothetical protein
MSQILPTLFGKLSACGAARPLSSVPNSGLPWKAFLRGSCGNPATSMATIQAAKKQVADVLKKFQLDESAIEGEVIRKSLGAIAQLDSLLASLESRRNKAVRLLVEWRGGLARQRGGSADRNFPALEHAANEKLAA